MKESDFASLASKKQMERILSGYVTSAHEAQNPIDWSSFSECFRSLGDNFSVEFISGGGFDGADIYRFTVDKSTLLTPLTSVPGASNDVYTTIINLTSDGDVAIVHRGGQLEWLRLE